VRTPAEKPESGLGNPRRTQPCVGDRSRHLNRRNAGIDLFALAWEGEALSRCAHVARPGTPEAARSIFPSRLLLPQALAPWWNTLNSPVTTRTKTPAAHVMMFTQSGPPSGVVRPETSPNEMAPIPTATKPAFRSALVVIGVLLPALNCTLVDGRANVEGRTSRGGKDQRAEGTQVFVRMRYVDPAAGAQLTSHSQVTGHRA
jgi:hypothetical protein